MTSSPPQSVQTPARFFSLPPIERAKMLIPTIGGEIPEGQASLGEQRQLEALQKAFEKRNAQVKKQKSSNPRKVTAPKPVMTPKLAMFLENTKRAEARKAARNLE
jgi:hypothetical protein